MPIRSILFVIAGIVAGALGTYTLVGRRDTPVDPPSSNASAVPIGVVELTPEALKSMGISTTVVTTSPLDIVLDVTGSVAPEDSRVSHIRPLGRGVIETVSVNLGEAVHKGDALLTYDNIELGEQIGGFQEARAAQRTAEADQEVKRLALNRANELIKVEGIALQTLELRRAELKSAEAAVASAQATVARIEESLHRFGLSDADLGRLGPEEGPGGHRAASHNVLRAPIDGVVTKYDVAPGELVEPERELFTITDLGTVWVLGDIYEKDLAGVKAGANAQVRVDAYPGRTFAGRLTYVSSVIDPQTRTAKARVVVPNTDGALKLDMFARIAVSMPTQRQALTVPSAAIQQVDGQAVVFLRQADRRFLKRDVATGVVTTERTEIREGVAAGDIVVTEGSFYLKTALLRERIGGGE